MKVVVTNNQPIGKVTFSKIAKVQSTGLRDLYDVNITLQKDGDVLVYNSATQSYIIETLPRVDGGFY